MAATESTSTSHASAKMNSPVHSTRMVSVSAAIGRYTRPHAAYCTTPPAASGMSEQKRFW